MRFSDVSRRGRVFLVSMVLALSAGCASNDPRDPLEPMNRVIYGFNDLLDKIIIKPVSQGYQAITPDPLDKGVTNFFNNLDDVSSILNNTLQFKLGRAASDVGRVVINSTVGILGLFDVATDLGMERTDEDFGQTLGAWGVGPGPYLVLPVLGPSNPRDTVGLVVDWFTDPVTYVDPTNLRYGLIVLRGIDKRADLLSASRVMEEAALDEYEFMRDTYLQKRRNDVYDGNPPMSEEAEALEEDVFKESDGDIQY